MQKNLNSEQPVPTKTTKENSLPQNFSQDVTVETSNSSEEPMEKIEVIRKNIEGFNTLYMSPFNIELEAVYVDHTATNRPYKTVEDMIKFTKKFAANPHTEFSHFGSIYLLIQNILLKWCIMLNTAYFVPFLPTLKNLWPCLQVQDQREPFKKPWR